MNWENIGIVSSIFLGVMFVAIFILSNMQLFNLVWLIGGGVFFIIALCGLYGKGSISSKVYKLIGIPLVIIELVLVVFVFLMSPESHNFSIIILSLTVLPLILLFAFFFVNLWLKTRRYQKGCKILEDLKYQEAFQFFEEYTKSDPNDPLACCGKSTVLLRLNKAEEALECANKAMGIKLGFKYFLIEKPIQCIQIYTKTNVLSALGQYEDALKYSNELLKLNSKNPSHWVYKGAILGELGDYEESLDSLNKALSLSPKDPYALSSKGETLRKMGDYSEAMEYIERALAIKPKTPGFWLIKGKTLIAMNKNEEALKLIDMALELDPIFKNAIEAKEELLGLEK
jgi:tetratricopeptide (TPR) repeat protein